MLNTLFFGSLDISYFPAESLIRITDMANRHKTKLCSCIKERMWDFQLVTEHNAVTSLKDISVELLCHTTLQTVLNQPVDFFLHVKLNNMIISKLKSIKLLKTVQIKSQQLIIK